MNVMAKFCPSTVTKSFFFCEGCRASFIVISFLRENRGNVAAVGSSFNQQEADRFAADASGADNKPYHFTNVQMERLYE